MFIFKENTFPFVFRKDFDVYVNSLRNSNNSIARKTLSWCDFLQANTMCFGLG